MSIHVTFMPIDVNLFQTKVFGYLRGTETVDDLRPQMTRAATNAAFVQPWSLLLIGTHYDSPDKLPAWFNHEVVCLERPYFIVEDEPVRVAHAAEDYHLAPGPKALRAAVNAQLAVLDPEGWQKRGRWKATEPDLSGVEGKVDAAFALLAKYLAAPPKKGKGGKAKKAGWDLEFASDVLGFNEALQPCWSVNEYFTESIIGVSAALTGCFEIPHALFRPLFKEHPELQKALSSPHRNETVGLYVPPSRVGRARRAAEAALPTPHPEDGEGYEVNALRRLTEVLTYAERNGLGFAERIS